MFGTEVCIGSFFEIIVFGVFCFVLVGDVFVLFDYDLMCVFGCMRFGMFCLLEDMCGFVFSFDFFDIVVGCDVFVFVEWGDLGGMLFGFNVLFGGEFWVGEKCILSVVDLKEILIVLVWFVYFDIEIVFWLCGVLDFECCCWVLILVEIF